MATLSTFAFMLNALAVGWLFGRLVFLPSMNFSSSSPVVGVGLIVVVQSSFVPFVTAKSALIIALLVLYFGLGIGLIIKRRHGNFNNYRCEFRPWARAQVLAVVATVPALVSALSPQIRLRHWSFTHAAPSSDLLAFISIANYLKMNPYFPIQTPGDVSFGWSWIPQHQAAALRIGDSLIHANLAFFDRQISPAQFLIGMSTAIWLLAVATLNLFSVLTEHLSVSRKSIFACLITIVVCSSSFVVNGFLLQSSAFLFGLAFFFFTVSTLVPILRGDDITWERLVVLGLGLASLVAVYPEALVLVLPTIVISFVRLKRRATTLLLITIPLAFIANPFGSWLWMKSALIQARIGENGFFSPFHDLPVVHFLARSVGAFGPKFLETFNTPVRLSQDKAFLSLAGAVIAVVFVAAVSKSRGVIRSSGIALCLVWFVAAFVVVSVVRAQEYLEYRLLFIGLPLFFFCGLVACVALWHGSASGRLLCAVVIGSSLLLNVIPTQESAYLESDVLRDRSIDDSYLSIVDFFEHTDAEDSVVTLFARDFVEQTTLSYLLREIPNLQVFNPWNVYLTSSEVDSWSKGLGRFIIADRSTVVTSDAYAVVLKTDRFQIVDTSRGNFSLSTVGQDWLPRAVNNPQTSFTNLIGNDESVVWVFSNQDRASVTLSRRPGLRKAPLEAFNLADASMTVDPKIRVLQNDYCYRIIVEGLTRSRWLAIRLEGPFGMVFNPSSSSC